MSFLQNLTLLFIGLKLTGYISSGWFLILLPYLIEISLKLSIVGLNKIIEKLENNLKIESKNNEKE